MNTSVNMSSIFATLAKLFPSLYLVPPPPSTSPTTSSPSPLSLSSSPPIIAIVRFWSSISDWANWSSNYLNCCNQILPSLHRPIFNTRSWHSCLKFVMSMMVFVILSMLVMCVIVFVMLSMSRWSDLVSNQLCHIDSKC